MINVLYIGNKLSLKRSNISAISILGPLLETSGYKLQYASTKANKFLRLVDMIWACFMMRKKVDFVIIDTYSTQNFYFAFILSQLCRLLKLKYIPILHGGNLENRLRNTPKLSGLLFNHSRVNVAPSLFIKSVFESYGYSQIVYIPNTLEIQKYPFEERPIKTIKMLWVRSFSSIYNPLLAVKILKQLQEKGFDSELCMVGPDSGDGSFQDVKQLAFELGVSVLFPGKLSKTEWIALAKDYNIFINTTNFDNMPVSVLEVMALGLPVVSTNAGGMPYLIGNGIDGFLVPKDDKMAFVNAIIKLYSEPHLVSDLVINARKKVEQLDWEIVKYQWFDILK
ncbi:glycosyl transferase family 1 [Hanstruepera neustonica]|uniref:Glycosyl transferase family 1 n=1 Tax=Hanstruepera neustonica TaxID=1445657 RepID=A0A2K1DVN1_9FLAO|nr:glycosyltransferase family 4 protein [Hanstruepera neustonica]PNQ72084.1 glycosyl transferase family 1 [Hanstruepera neustonica]